MRPNWKSAEWLARCSSQVTNGVLFGAFLGLIGGVLRDGKFSLPDVAAGSITCGGFVIVMCVLYTLFDSVGD